MAEKTTLHALKKEDVQRICSGQSVVDLATAVKEMVENALDAGATVIEVKLKEFGRECIEVSDNGSGVSPDNYASLALKHYTSKISSFEDIDSIASFGFRGEALSSICQLAASFSVVTRTKDEQLGTLLVYDGAGKVTKETKKARPVGTTIIVEDLFKPLPVRYKDFHKNIKKHYTKLLRVLQSYALICTHVKLSVVNMSGKSGNRQVVLSTQAQQGSIAENIASVFGMKFFRTLVSVDFDLNEDKEVWQLRRQQEAASQASQGAGGNLSDNDEDGRDVESQSTVASVEDEDQARELSKRRQVTGFVSRVGEGVGRSDNDRQFFYINGRPFDLPKITKAANEVWRQFEMKQKPACVLNFDLPLGEFDVNVTPDKRETFLKHEGEIVEAFKRLLTKVYQPSRGTFTVQPLLSTYAKSSVKDEKAEKKEDTVEPHDNGGESNTTPANDRAKDEGLRDHNGTKVTLGKRGSVSPAADVEQVQPSTKKSRPTTPEVTSPSGCCEHSSPVETPADRQTSFLRLDRALQSRADVLPTPTPSKSEEDFASPTTPIVLGSSDRKPRSARKSPATKGVESVADWSLVQMMEARQRYFQQEVQIEQARQATATAAKTCSTAVTNAAGTGELDHDVATAALQRVLTKEDFRRMEVLGQFNLGFIIAKLDDDLFIIDQHASDEKYNFEMLQRTTVMHQQPLVRPLPLELTAGEEMVIVDHMDLFARNGFTFQVDKDAPATKKLRLLSLPFSKHTQFGIEDIRELASLLMDSPLNPASIRLPKVMAMFASRACRSSIMIGTALHKEEMQKIVRNLATLDQPWNCPHGRPTLRHLVDLKHVTQGAGSRK